MVGRRCRYRLCRGPDGSTESPRRPVRPAVPGLWANASRSGCWRAAQRGTAHRRWRPWLCGSCAPSIIDGGQIVTKGATGTGSAPVEIASVSQRRHVKSAGIPAHDKQIGCRLRRWPGREVHLLWPHPGQTPRSAHRCVDAAVAQVLTGPGRSVAWVGHPLAPAARELPVGNQRAAPFGWSACWG